MTGRPRRCLSFLSLPAGVGLLLLAACEEGPEEINSVLLAGGAYVRIENRQDRTQPLDTTSLAALNKDVFSLEIRAAGDTLPTGHREVPTLFMVGNAQGDNEIGVYRTPYDSISVLIFLGDRNMGTYDIPGCDWNDPDVFTQVVITYDSTTLYVYGNGEFLGDTTVNIDLDIYTSDALIGADWDDLNDTTTISNFWYGAIDEVRLWTKVLPAGEMAFRYQNPAKLTKNYSPTGLDQLIGLWRFDRRGSDGDTVPDGSGKGNDGVLNAGAGRLDFTDAGA